MQGIRKRMSHYDPSQPSQSQWPRPDARIQTEWQQPASQPLPQPSIQAPRPPTKKARGRLRIILGLVVALIAILGVVVSGHNNTSHSTKSTKSTPVSAKQQHQATQVVMTPTPQPTLVIQAIGKSVVVDSTWTVTLNGARTSLGDIFSTPGSGNVYLVVDVTVKNTSKHFQDMLSGNQIVLKDSTGQQFREAITDFAIPPDGTIKPGGSQRGQLAYEIPATMHTFSYYFQADTNGTDLTEWVLHV
jgi:hypothetical protein